MIYGTMCYLKNGGETLFFCRDYAMDEIHLGFTYTLPGGYLEGGRNSVDCAVREFEEETGLRVIDPRLRVIATFYNEKRIFGKNEVEDQKFYIYEANAFSGALREGPPEGELVWISDNKLPEIKIHGGDRKILELMRQKGLFEVDVRCRGQELVGFEAIRVN